MQGLIKEHTASVLSQDPSDKAPPLHELFVQPDPSHMRTKVWPGICLRPWSSWYLTLLSGKQKQHWSDAHTPHPSEKLFKCRNMQQGAPKPHHQQTKYPTPCSSYPKRIKWCFRDLGTKHHLYRHMSPVNHQLQFCCNQATLTCLGFSKLPLQLCAQLINRKQLVNPAKIQTLALRIKAGKNCFCFVFSENLFSLPALPKKALDR